MKNLMEELFKLHLELESIKIKIQNIEDILSKFSEEQFFDVDQQRDLIDQKIALLNHGVSVCYSIKEKEEFILDCEHDS